MQKIKMIRMLPIVVEMPEVVQTRRKENMKVLAGTNTDTILGVGVWKLDPFHRKESYCMYC